MLQLLPPATIDAVARDHIDRGMRRQDGERPTEVGRSQLLQEGGFGRQSLNFTVTLSRSVAPLSLTASA
jgi:hypothetical protein